MLIETSIKVLDILKEEWNKSEYSTLKHCFDSLPIEINICMRMSLLYGIILIPGEKVCCRNEDVVLNEADVRRFMKKFAKFTTGEMLASSDEDEVFAKYVFNEDQNVEILYRHTI